jgi:hypothetical protein
MKPSNKNKTKDSSKKVSSKKKPLKKNNHESILIKQQPKPPLNSKKLSGVSEKILDLLGGSKYLNEFDYNEAFAKVLLSKKPFKQPPTN